MCWTKKDNTLRSSQRDLIRLVCVCLIHTCLCLAIKEHIVCHSKTFKASLENLKRSFEVKKYSLKIQDTKDFIVYRKVTENLLW